MKWTIEILRVACVVLGLSSVTACDMQDMYEQPKYAPLEPSPFFNDDRSARPLVGDTVAQGELRTNTEFFTGKSGMNLVTVIPVVVTKALLERGEERYNIFCAPCHDAVGNGNGMIVQRGFRQPPSLHIPRLQDAPIGHFYDVMSNGFGLSPDFSAQISPEDRWAIAAYLRALQLSQHAPLADVPADQRHELEAKGP
jgi:mono/diheme cytochrome c family protein